MGKHWVLNVVKGCFLYVNFSEGCHTTILCVANEIIVKTE